MGAILAGNNLVNVAVQLLEPAFGSEIAMLATTLVMTFLLLIFSEITPKTLSAYHAEETSFFVARPIHHRLR